MWPFLHRFQVQVEGPTDHLAGGKVHGTLLAAHQRPLTSEAGIAETTGLTARAGF